MPRVVILGAGFGGLTVASELDPLAAAKELDVTLVDRNTHFNMGFTLQWTLAGRRSAEEGHRPYTSLRSRHVTFVHDEIAAIDTDARVVETKSGPLEYDDLVIALGAELAPETIPGLAEGAYNLCDAESVSQLKSVLDRLEWGTVVVAISALPFKCPPAPYEYAFLIDELLRTRGVRSKVRLVVTTPEPQPMPVAGRAVGNAVKAMMKEHKIEYLPQYPLIGVDVPKRVVVYEDRDDLPYSVLAAMPPHRAPKVVRDAELTDTSGFVAVDLRTLETTVPHVFAIGDVARLKLPSGSPHPKAGVFAEAQGATVARAIASRVKGGKPPRYPGSGVCYVDVGDDQAAPARIDLLAKGGPRATLQPPSKAGLEDKVRFERERFERWFGG